MQTIPLAFQPILDRCVRLAVVSILLTSVFFIPGSTPSAVANMQTNLPGPAGSGGFGQVTVLPNGNIVILDPGYDIVLAPGNDAPSPPISDIGAVYLYNGVTGALISTLTGSTPGDLTGSSVITLPNGHYLVLSPEWDNGAAVNAGAVTWGNATTGVSGVVSVDNSLVGSMTDDNVGSGGVTILTNGNYVVRSPSWQTATRVWGGAVTWGSGVTGVRGVVSAANSLVGSKPGDWIGSSVTALTNGSYVVGSPDWDNGAAVDAGAVTWGSGITGVSGAVSAANSLLGSTAGDNIGWCYHVCVKALTNGSYLVLSPNWDNGGAAEAGAVTWGSGTVGVSGVLSATNSLVGSKADGRVGFSLDDVTELTNGNYVVTSSGWVTWGSGATGVSGELSAANSLAGSGSVTWLTNGNYVVIGEAVHLCNGATGALISTLTGPTAGDLNSSYAKRLSNGNYVVASPKWDNGVTADAGAVTWGNGLTGVNGVLSAANSLVGTSADDNIGDYGVTALTNGNYVVSSPGWDNGAAADAGAVTWGSGVTGVTGAVSPGNSLVGSTPGDNVGRNSDCWTDCLTVLNNGNYVVVSSNWDNSTAVDAGAVTWGSGTTGVSGVVSAANSLVGSTAYDKIGSAADGVIALTNGSYVVRSPNWDNGLATGASAVIDAGAVTWGSGTAGVHGTISAANSLVGSTAGDNVGIYEVTALINGNYVVRSPFWDNHTAVDAGAVTWGSGAIGVSGAVSEANSLVGSTAYDRIGYGGVTELSNGSYVVRSFYWDNAAAIDAGAVTWGNGMTGVRGFVSAANSLVGSTAGDRVGGNSDCWSSCLTVLSDGSFVVVSPWWDNSLAAGAGAVVNAGAVTLGLSTACTANLTQGAITSANSVPGTTAGGGGLLNFGYDTFTHQLVVGRPADNIVSLFLPSDCAYHTFVPLIGK